MIFGSCTGWFDGYWQRCCDLHDLAYSVGVPKTQADFDLASCVAQSGHAGIAVLMLVAVTLFGWIFYPRKKR